MSDDGPWHYQAGSESKGPFSREQMAGFLAAGVIDAHALIWSEAAPQWTPLFQTELRPLLGDSPVSPPARTVPQIAASSSPPPESVGFQDAVKAFFAGYATFSGRATRPEYWFAVLFLILSILGTAILDGVLFGSSPGVTPISWLWQLATFLPSVAVTVRRLHDTDRSGWNYLWVFLPIIGAILLIVFCCQRGTAGANRYG